VINLKNKPRTAQPAEQEPIVYVLDDDKDVREGLKAVLDSVHLPNRLLSSTMAFWPERVDAVSCLVLDLRLPGQSGLDFQKELARAGVEIPVIFLSGHGDIPVAVRAMKAGAIGFLTKPCREQDLLDAVRAALETDRKRRNEKKQSAQLKTRYESLTERERQVMPWVVSGTMNKQTAYELDLSEVTVKVHRSNLMHKLEARSLVDLVKMALALGIPALDQIRAEGK